MILNIISGEVLKGLTTVVLFIPKVTIANGPDDRLTIDDCSFGIKGNTFFLSLKMKRFEVSLQSCLQG